MNSGLFTVFTVSPLNSIFSFMSISFPNPHSSSQEGIDPSGQNRHRLMMTRGKILLPDTTEKLQHAQTAHIQNCLL